MRAVQAHSSGVKVVEVDEPEGPGELVRVMSASICASDFLFMGMGSSQTLGHELAGLTADGVAVAVEGIFGCGDCAWCDAGSYNLCRRTSEEILGLTVAGGMSEYFRAPARALVPLPEALPVADASLVEPTAVAWHANTVGEVGPDTTVAIVGAGAIGLLAVAAARELGAADIAIAARHPHQQEAAERFGAAHASGFYDVVLETGGSEDSLHRAVELCRPRGTVVIVGVHGPDVTWPHQAAFAKEVRTAPALGYAESDRRREFAAAAELLSTRPEIAETLITHRFPLDDAHEAFRIARDRTSGALRVVLEP
jgi:2-desacetyl-2-hydroxyethyl bacteriochlorophyllide A dehydrogenase